MVAGTLKHKLEQACSALREVVGSVELLSLSADEALGFVDLLAQGERTAASGIALLTPRVVEAGSFAKVGHGSAPDWLAAVSGSSAGVAKGRLTSAAAAARSPELSGALRGGELSAPQLKLLAETESVDPGAAGRLLEMVDGHASHQQLFDAASHMKAAARCRETERARRARVHVNRHMTWRQDPGGGIRGEFLCDEVAWAPVARRLESDAKARWKAAGAGSDDTFEAHRLDAFLDLLAGSEGRGSEGGGGGAHPRVLVIVDAEALRRGTTTTGEVCEIDGIGPVSVEAVTELLGEAGMQFLVKEGKDIRTVTKTTRDLAQRTAVALIARDRSCGVNNCGKRHGLEADHTGVDYADDGPTTYENMTLLCGPHHALKTHGGWTLVDGELIAPAHPKSANYIRRARRLAAVKAKARTERSGPGGSPGQKRNKPRQS